MIRWPVLLLLAVWTLCAAIGTASMIRYEFTPGIRRPAPSDWPTGAETKLDAARPTLLLFLHPQCPCSRATLAEMQRLLADCGWQFALHIFFVQPAGADDDWENTHVCRAARQIPGALIHCD